MSDSPEIRVDCRDCRSTFAISSSEQSFYLERGLRFPVICPVCRVQNRAERNLGLIRHYQTHHEIATWSESLGHYGGPTDALSQQNQRGARGASFQVTCASCGSETTVPFVPRGGRPVYCRQCFNLRRSSQGSQRR